MAVQFRTDDGLADEPVSRANPLPVTATGGASETSMAALLALVGTADDAAGANTVIGQLKQIVANTAA